MSDWAKLGHLVGDFHEKLCDGKVWMGYRFWNLRTVPRSVTLGRPPAPWCPMPWNKTYAPQITSFSRRLLIRTVINAMRDGQRKGWT